MTEHTEDPAGDYARARDEDEPGAHSGSESQARERTIPGTASAGEGYRPGQGTAAGDPLEGVVKDSDDEGGEGGGA